MSPTPMLPRPDDHAFASGGSFGKPEPAGLLSRALGRLGSMLIAANDRRLARAIWVQFELGAVLGEDVRFGYGARLINLAGRDRARVGARSVIRGVIRLEANANLEVGEAVYIGDGSLISAAAAVQIGDGTLIAHDVQIFDNASHPIDPDERRRQWRHILKIEKIPRADLVPLSGKPVIVGRDCWLGFGSVVMAGSKIGDRSIVSAGSIVRGDVPADVIYRAGPVGEPEITPIRREA